VIRSQNDIHFVVDVSKVSPPPDAILHELRVKFQSPVTLKSYELIGDLWVVSKGVMTELNVATTT